VASSVSETHHEFCVKACLEEEKGQAIAMKRIVIAVALGGTQAACPPESGHKT
jgi:hypothetical protein